MKTRQLAVGFSLDISCIDTTADKIRMGVWSSGMISHLHFPGRQALRRSRVRSAVRPLFWHILVCCFVGFVFFPVSSLCFLPCRLHSASCHSARLGLWLLLPFFTRRAFPALLSFLLLFFFFFFFLCSFPSLPFPWFLLSWFLLSCLSAIHLPLSF